MKILCVIPARGGSKGLPGKNILQLAGRPLIYWPIKAALSCDLIDKVVVTTDSQEIADCALEAGADIPFLRPPELAQDLTTTEKTLQHALNKCEEIYNEIYDICVFLTATDVFRSIEWIHKAIDALIKDAEIESAFSVHQTTKNYWHNNDGRWERVLPWMRDYSSRQVRQMTYREDTGMASASRSWLWREGRRIGDKVCLIPNDLPETAIDIHTDFDLFLAEKAIEFLKKYYPERVALFMEQN